MIPNECPRNLLQILSQIFTTWIRYSANFKYSHSYILILWFLFFEFCLNNVCSVQHTNRYPAASTVFMCILCQDKADNIKHKSRTDKDITVLLTAHKQSHRCTLILQCWQFVFSLSLSPSVFVCENKKENSCKAKENTLLYPYRDWMIL